MSTIDPRAHNALKDGLYSSTNLILAGEESEYDDLRQAFYNELLPSGAIEESLFEDIVSAKWRIRRAGMIEASLVRRTALDEDGVPFLDEEGEKRQRSADRARAQAQTAIHRAMAELRKLQTNRQLKAELKVEKMDHVLIDMQVVANAAVKVQKARYQVQKDMERQLDKELMDDDDPTDYSTDWATAIAKHKEHLAALENPNETLICKNEKPKEKAA